MKILVLSCLLLTGCEIVDIGGHEVLSTWRPRDAYGNIKYHEDGFATKGNKLVIVDRYGNTQYHKGSYVRVK